MSIYRNCMICNTHYGCYTDRKRTCRSCRLNVCPVTSDVSHGLCEKCSKEGMKLFDEEFPSPSLAHP